MSQVTKEQRSQTIKVDRFARSVKRGCAIAVWLLAFADTF